MLSRNEVYEYMNVYEPAVLNQVLEKLGYGGCDEYPEDIVEKIEAVFKTVEDAHAALPQAQTEAITIRNTAAMATLDLEQASISVPQEIIFYLAKQATEGLRQNAKQIAALSQKVFAETLREEQENFYLKVAEALEASRQQTDDQMQSIADAFVKHSQSKPKFDAAGAIQKLEAERQQRQKEENERQQREAKLAAERRKAAEIDLNVFVNQLL